MLRTIVLHKVKPEQRIEGRTVWPVETANPDVTYPYIEWIAYHQRENSILITPSNDERHVSLFTACR